MVLLDLGLSDHCSDLLDSCLLAVWPGVIKMDEPVLEDFTLSLFLLEFTIFLFISTESFIIMKYFFMLQKVY